MEIMEIEKQIRRTLEPARRVTGLGAYVSTKILLEQVDAQYPNGSWQSGVIKSIDKHLQKRLINK